MCYKCDYLEFTKYFFLFAFESEMIIIAFADILDAFKILNN